MSTGVVARLPISAFLLGASVAAGCGPTSPTPPTQTQSILISPSDAVAPRQLAATLNDISGHPDRYVVNPLIQFAAGATGATAVKEVRFSFVVDVDRPIREGVFLVHNGDLRSGPVTQQYPLPFNVGVHFPNLRIRIRAVFVNDLGSTMLSPAAEATIQLPVARP